MSHYAELHLHSAYSFLTGVSEPDELVKRATELELSALAITDYDGFPGVVRFAQAARKYCMPTVIGSELRLAQHGPHMVVLAKSVAGYHALSRCIGQAFLASSEKTSAAYDISTLAEQSNDMWHIFTGARHSHVYRVLEQKSGVWAVDVARQELQKLIDLFGVDNITMELVAYGDPYDRERRLLLRRIAKEAGIACVATGDVHMAYQNQKPLGDVLAATRYRKTLEQIRPKLDVSARVLRSRQHMLEIQRDYPQAVDYAGELGQRYAIDFSLLKPNLPPFPVPAPYNEHSWLSHLVERGAYSRYGDRTQAPDAWRVIDHELQVIEELSFSGYFLIVEEIVSFCRQEQIWCQGRGSAANSAVCFALGITAVDAARHKMLFERFLSPDRVEPPDIDLDIEARERERVIQHIYQRYGRVNAAQVANVITYRSRSAIRDSARALGYDTVQIDKWMGREHNAGLADAVPQKVAEVAQQMQRLPRHLGIHSGGMVLCDRPIIEVCPVQWATKPGRTVLQWDKEDCAEAGLVKFDLLGLGMLSALRIAFTQIQRYDVRGFDGKLVGLHNIDQEDSRVYDLLCAADTVGVFQVESRAQMATLPRLRPRTFYDIVIEVALVRPGPIQGGSVHPYISRRRGHEKVSYAHPLLKPALEKTLGIPLFQEQLMRIAIDTAGFSPAQADQLRKAMSAKRSHERVAQLHDELINGMSKRGIDRVTAEEIFRKLDAFADFGFPESHAFSFAYLVYASAWLKAHYPEHFYAALLASQPLGFYSPQSLLADARLHGINILPIDVCWSELSASVQEFSAHQAQGDLERMSYVDKHPHWGIRLGLSDISGLGKAAERVIQARKTRSFTSVADLAYRAELSDQHIHCLAGAGALDGLGVSRREGMWAAQSVAFTGQHASGYFQPTIPGTEFGVHSGSLPEMSAEEKQQADFYFTHTTPFHHPMEFHRHFLARDGVLTIRQASEQALGSRLRIAGCVTHRQRPRTANGMTFISLEDETGMMNIVCSYGLWERYKAELKNNALIIRGMVERCDGAVSFIADGIEMLETIVRSNSRDFR